MDINAVIPFTLLNWLSRQEKVKVSLYKNEDSESWIIIPPWECIKDNYSQRLYDDLLNSHEEEKTIVLNKKEIKITPRYPLNSESTDYEEEPDLYSCEDEGGQCDDEGVDPDEDRDESDLELEYFA